MKVKKCLDEFFRDEEGVVMYLNNVIYRGKQILSPNDIIIYDVKEYYTKEKLEKIGFPIEMKRDALIKIIPDHILLGIHFMTEKNEKLFLAFKIYDAIDKLLHLEFYNERCEVHTFGIYLSEDFIKELSLLLNFKE